MELRALALVDVGRGRSYRGFIHLALPDMLQLCDALDVLTGTLWMPEPWLEVGVTDLRLYSLHKPGDVEPVGTKWIRWWAPRFNLKGWTELGEYDFTADVVLSPGRPTPDYEGDDVSFTWSYEKSMPDETAPTTS